MASDPTTRSKRPPKTTVSRDHLQSVSGWLGSSCPPWASHIFAFALMFLTAGVSTVEQYALHPVYGSIPASLHHRNATIQAAVGATVLACFVTPNRSSLWRILHLLPLHVFSIPLLSYYLLFRWSGSFGPEWGPVAQEVLTSVPLLFLTIYAVTFLILFAGPQGEEPRSGRIILVAALSFGIFVLVEETLQRWMPMIFGTLAVLTRSGLEVILALAFALLLPSKLLIVALPALYFSLQINPHAVLPSTTNKLNLALQNEGYSLVERTESLTGYISVLDDDRNQFRVLRCDHSLLGGEWWATPERARSGIVIREPVYTIFTMLESVRLMQNLNVHDDPSLIDHEISNESALVVGLGIGTCPAALSSHGIETHAIEIDPAVSAFATKYFGLPANVNVINDDAVRFTREAERRHQRFDYIVHDVFTGGAEPVSLYTFEFLESLKKLLKDDGSIAINYAGDLNAHSTAVVLHTVLSVFGNCKVFRDQGPSEDGIDADFANIVLFCKNSDKNWKFRPPVEADFLKSEARREFLVPSIEVDVNHLCAGLGEESIVTKRNSDMLKSTQAKSAIDHWKIMRQVLPDAVWELW